MLWSSEEFGFCELSDAWASGSSIMPQKKNPDAAELLRAKAPRIAGHLLALHGVLHGLPLTYNKDMQEDKEHLFDAADTLALVARGGPRDAGDVTFRRERLAAASDDEFIAATDVADLLVKRGLPFRQAHGGRRRASFGSRSPAGERCPSYREDELRAALATARRGALLRAAAGPRLARVEGLPWRHRARGVRAQLVRAREVLSQARSGRW